MTKALAAFFFLLSSNLSARVDAESPLKANWKRPPSLATGFNVCIYWAVSVFGPQASLLILTLLPPGCIGCPELDYTIFWNRNSYSTIRHFNPHNKTQWDNAVYLRGLHFSFLLVTFVHFLFHPLFFSLHLLSSFFLLTFYYDNKWERAAVLFLCKLWIGITNFI